MKSEFNSRDLQSKDAPALKTSREEKSDPQSKDSPVRKWIRTHGHTHRMGMAARTTTRSWRNRS
jgi:hypothetical protein